MSDLVLHAGFSFLTAFLGALGGIGGATILVPLLMVTGLGILEAAPLGLVSVAATSLMAGVLRNPPPTPAIPEIAPAVAATPSPSPTRRAW